MLQTPLSQHVPDCIPLTIISQKLSLAGGELQHLSNSRMDLRPTTLQPLDTTLSAGHLFPIVPLILLVQIYQHQFRMF